MLKPEYFELPSDGVVLFHAARSYCAQQVRLALEEKGVAWVSRPLSLRQAEHFAPAYARMNPHMVVPTLADRGRVLRDAWRLSRSRSALGRVSFGPITCSPLTAIDGVLVTPRSENFSVAWVAHAL